MKYSENKDWCRSLTEVIPNRKSAEIKVDVIQTEETVEHGVNKDTAISVNKDTAISVNNDTAISVNNDTAISVNNDTAISVNNDTAISVNNDTAISVNNDTAISVNKDTAISVNKDTTISVNTDTTISVNNDAIITSPLITTTSLDCSCNVLYESQDNNGDIDNVIIAGAETSVVLNVDNCSTICSISTTNSQ